MEYLDTRVSPDAYDDHVMQVLGMATLARKLLTRLQQTFI